MARVVVNVMPKAEILDPQGQAVVGALPRLGFAGVVSIALAISERGELVADPEVTLTGIPEVDAQGRRIEDIAYDAAVEAFESMPRARRRDPDAVAESVRRAIRAQLGAAWNKKPTCHVHVLEV